jgi:APA family basic amino acid/polyamine antiporter
MASDAKSIQLQGKPEMRKTLSLLGLTINAMALIAPGAFLWITLQVQAAQADPAGVSTATDIWFGLFAALILSFLTAASYAWLSRRYPESGAGSSYYFAQRAWLDRGNSNRSARDAKFAVGWLSHLYYWVYPGVMVAFMSVLITWVLQTLGFAVSPLAQIAIAFAFAVVTGFIAYRGIQGSTRTNLLLNIVQLTMLVGVTTMALAYRFSNPQHVSFTFSNIGGIVMPHDGSHVLFQATLAILVLVGFETATALTAEAKNPKDVPKAVILSLAIQGAFAYLFAYFGFEAWVNSGYTVVSNGQTLTGLSAAAVSSAPYGDMVRNLGNVFLGGNGFVLMMIVAVAVAAAILGTTLACMNTGVRVTYAISRDTEIPQHMSKMNPRYATPGIGVWVMTAVSAAIGAFGVLSVRNLTAVSLLSNVGTFLLYGVTNVIAVLAFAKERSSILKRKLIPLIGLGANMLMLGAVVWLGFLGGGDSAWEALFALAGTGIWLLLGLVYFRANSRTEPSPLFPFPGKEPEKDKQVKYSIHGD